MAIDPWTIDTAHSGILFTVRHMVIAKVRGTFDRWHGSLAFDEAHPANSKVSVQIEVASIDTREPKRDEHLRSADFLDAELYPEIVFESTRAEALGGERYRAVGNLTIHGVTREVAFEAEYLGRRTDPWGVERLADQALTSINRKDFDLTWNQALEAGGVLVGEEVEIVLDVQE